MSHCICKQGRRPPCACAGGTDRAGIAASAIAWVAACALALWTVWGRIG